MGLRGERDNHLRHLGEQVMALGRALGGRRLPQEVHRRVSRPGAPLFREPSAGCGSAGSEGGDRLWFGDEWGRLGGGVAFSGFIVF